MTETQMSQLPEPAGTTADELPTAAAETAAAPEPVLADPPGPGVDVAPAAPRRPRRVLRAVARWTCAVLAFVAAAAGTAYVVTEKERSELPGLATEHDGRWEYPALKLPALPKGKPGPFDKGNEADAHHADLRTLLLPAPEGAKADKALPGRGGWLPLSSFVKAYAEDERTFLTAGLTEAGLKHIAATGWTMPDGTRTRVYLLRFGSFEVARDTGERLFGSGYLPQTKLLGAADMEPDSTWTKKNSAGGDITRSAFVEAAPHGKLHVRQGYLLAGDLVGIVVQDKPGTTPVVPFHQTLILQSQLLG